MTRLFIACIALLAGTANAAEPATRPSFENADTNHDGKIGPEEFRASMGRFLEQRASEGGRASRLSPQQRERAIGRMFTRLDTSQDGAVDPAEWEAGVKRAEDKAAERARGSSR
jgi:hypothetical protein